MKIIKSPGCTHIQTDKAGVFVVSCRECYEKAIKAARLDEAREIRKRLIALYADDGKDSGLYIQVLIEQRHPELRDEKGGTE